ISRDHTELLGDTLAEIAAEKAGIIKPGSVVVTAPQTGEVDEVLARVCAQKGADRVSVGADVTWESKAAGRAGQRFTVGGLSGPYDLEMPLLGDHQLENAAVAVGALESLVRLGWNIPPDSIQRGFREIRWPGRLEVLSERPLLVVDGAHNGYSAGKLRESLLKYFQFQRAVLIIGVSSDKNTRDIAAELLPIASRVIITRSRHPRAAAPSDVAPAFQSPDIMVEVADGVDEALGKAYAATGPEDLICAAGSLFIVGEVIEAVKKVPVESYVGFGEHAPHG
ncbi:MAG: bifunctional folylpolyglutamate synthase/dihydrofolate synthase, partial [Dehalococcoidia bacterium]